MATCKVRGLVEVPFEVNSMVKIVASTGMLPHGNEVFVGMTGSIVRYTLRTVASGMFELVAIVVFEFSTPTSRLQSDIPIRYLEAA